MTDRTGPIDYARQQQAEREQQPETSDPAQCSGEEGFCPEHGYHRQSLKQPGRHTADTINDNDLDQLYADAEEHKQNYLNACKTIAAMHEAAMGQVCGPTHGVVEDVADVRGARLRAEAAIARVRAELDRIAALPTVDKTEDRSNRFSVGASWTIRLLRKALDAPKEPRL